MSAETNAASSKPAASVRDRIIVDHFDALDPNSESINRRRYYDYKEYGSFPIPKFYIRTCKSSSGGATTEERRRQKDAYGTFRLRTWPEFAEFYRAQLEHAETSPLHELQLGNIAGFSKFFNCALVEDSELGGPNQLPFKYAYEKVYKAKYGDKKTAFLTPYFSHAYQQKEYEEKQGNIGTVRHLALVPEVERLVRDKYADKSKLPIFWAPCGVGGRNSGKQRSARTHERSSSTTTCVGFSPPEHAYRGEPAHLTAAHAPMLGKMYAPYVSKMKMGKWKILRYLEGDFMAPHFDSRKSKEHVAVSILIPPGLDVDGGDLVFYEDEDAQEEALRVPCAKQSRWARVTFPFNILHECTPVTRGARFVFQMPILAPEDVATVIDAAMKEQVISPRSNIGAAASGGVSAIVRDYYGSFESSKREAEDAHKTDNSEYDDDDDDDDDEDDDEDENDETELDREYNSINGGRCAAEADTCPGIAVGEESTTYMAELSELSCDFSHLLNKMSRVLNRSNLLISPGILKTYAGVQRVGNRVRKHFRRRARDAATSLSPSSYVPCDRIKNVVALCVESILHRAKIKGGPMAWFYVLTRPYNSNDPDDLMPNDRYVFDALEGLKLAEPTCGVQAVMLRRETYKCVTHADRYASDRMSYSFLDGGDDDEAGGYYGYGDGGRSISRKLLNLNAREGAANNGVVGSQYSEFNDEGGYDVTVMRSIHVIMVYQLLELD